MWLSIQNAITEHLAGKVVGDMSFFETILHLIKLYGPAYLKGAGVTLTIALVSTLIGCIIGLAVGVAQTVPVSKKDTLFKRFFVRLLRIVLNIYVEVFRGTPMMIQAVFVYYGMAQLWNIHMGMWSAAFFVVSINTGAYMAETVRGGILSIDTGQTEGAKAIGMKHVQTMVHVIMPQTLRNIMPQIGNNLVINVKDTCVLSAISTVELFFVHRGVAGSLFTYFESATITMVIYLTMTWTLSRLLRLAEKRMDGDDSYDLATQDTLAHTTGLYSYPGKGSNFDERHPEESLEKSPEDLLAETKSKGRKKQ